MAREVRVDFVGSDASIKKAASGAESALRQLSGGVSTVKTALAGLGVAFGAREMIRGIGDVVSAWNAQEDATASLRAALITTGRDGSTALAMLAAGANKLQEETTYSNDAIERATGTLAQLAKQLTPAQLEQAQKVIVGFSSTFGIDLNNSAVLVGKTLTASTNALQRYGIEINTSATQGQKLNQIVKQMGAAFDVAKARANTFGGSMTQLHNAWVDAEKQMGRFIALMAGGSNQMHGVRSDVEQLTRWFNTNMTTIVNWSRLFISVGEAIGTVLDAIIIGFADLAGAIYHVDHAIVTLNFGELKKAKNSLFDIGNVADTVAGAFGDVNKAWDNAVNGVNTNPMHVGVTTTSTAGGPHAPTGAAGVGIGAIPQTVDSLKKLDVQYAAVAKQLKGAQFSAALETDAKKSAALQTQVAQLTQKLNALGHARAALAGNLEKNLGTGANPTTQLFTGGAPGLDMRHIVDQITPTVKPALDKFSQTVRQQAANVGRSLIQGIMQGANNAQDLIKNFLINFATEKIMGPLNKALGVASPSTLTTYMGEMLAEGLVVGMGNYQGRIQAAVARATSAVALPGTPAVAAAGATHNVTMHVTQQYNVQALDAKGVAEMLHKHAPTIAANTARELQHYPALRRAFQQDI